MKFVFLMGGFIGFALAAAAGLAAGRASGPVLRDAAIGCLAGALLFRWFWSVVVKALADTLERRRRDARAAEDAAASGSGSDPAPAILPAPASTVRTPARAR